MEAALSRQRSPPRRSSPPRARASSPSDDFSDPRAANPADGDEQEDFDVVVPSELEGFRRVPPTSVAPSLAPSASVVVATAPVAPAVRDAISDWPPARVIALSAALKTAPWHERTYRFNKYPSVLTGVEIATWLSHSNFARSPMEAVAVAGAMLSRRMLFHLKPRKEAFVFHASEGYDYTPEDPETMEGVVSRIAAQFSAAARGNKASGPSGPGVFYKPQGNIVLACVEERQRKNAGVWSHEALTKSDPPHMSIGFDDVPLPAVGDAPPDLCEWFGEWAVDQAGFGGGSGSGGAGSPKPNRGGGGGDAAGGGSGWIYSVDFREGAKQQRTETPEVTLVRRRVWVRPARKKPERRRAEQNLGERVLSPGDRQQQADQELLQQAASVIRKARGGFLELVVVQGRELRRMCDSFVVVEYRDVRSQSAVCKKIREHRWDHKAFVTMQSDLEPLAIAVYQTNVVGVKSLLGRAEFFIPENEVEGSRTLRLKSGGENGGSLTASSGGGAGVGVGGSGGAAAAGVELAKGGKSKPTNTNNSNNDRFGSVRIDWRFSVDSSVEELTMAEAANNNNLQRCFLFLHIIGAKALVLNKRAIGLCGIGVTAALRRPDVFVRLSYKGEFCDMVCESPRIPFSLTPKWDWKTYIDLIPSAPLTIELWVAASTLHCVGKTAVMYGGVEDPGEADVKLYAPLAAVQQSLDDAAAAMTSTTSAAAGGPARGIPPPAAAASPSPPRRPAVLDDPFLLGAAEAEAAAGAARAADLAASAAVLAAGAALASAHYGTLSVKWKWTQGRDLLHEIIDERLDVADHFVPGATRSANLLEGWS